MLGTRTGQLAPQYDRLLRTLEQSWDAQQRVRVLGTMRSTDNVIVRFLASVQTDYVQVHVQHDGGGAGGATYNASTYVSSDRRDMRADRQRDETITRSTDAGYFVWLIPVQLQGDRTTYTKYDGVDGEDRMAFLDLGSRNDYLTGAAFDFGFDEGFEI